jgi:hypothetical protein
MVTPQPSRWQRLRRIIACQGIDGLVEELGARLRYRLHYPRATVPYDVFRSVDWARRRGVHTEGIVEIEGFAPDIPNREHAGSYIPTNPWSFRALIVALVDLGVQPREFTLVDMGYGKGRVILMGAQVGFREVIGVEFDPGLARYAAENLRDYRHSRGAAVSVHRGDAVDFPIPPGPLVVFLFNPFRGPVLEAVAENIRRSYVEHPRNTYVVYVWPRPDSPFGRSEPFKLVESGPEREIYHLVPDRT